MFFYDANMCGTGVDENSLLSWRGDCHVYDARLPLDSQNTNMSDGFISSNRSVLDPDGDGKVDVSGGFHDAGDHVKLVCLRLMPLQQWVGVTMNLKTSSVQRDRPSMLK